MFAMEIEAERRREVISATKLDAGRDARGHAKERVGSGTADVRTTMRGQERPVTAQRALRG
jgi:hypothetical protein